MITPLISIVSPVYGCRMSLIDLYHRVKESVEEITEDFELILVDDRSSDDPWDIIEGLSKKDSRVKGIRLSRNFGQHKSIYAGIKKSAGEWVVVMDCDLQDRPEEIIRLYEKAIENNSHVVLGRRSIRQDGIFKRLFSSLFYKFLGYLTDTDQDSTIANFGIYHRKAIDAICEMGDSFKYFPTMVRWVGFNKITLDIKHDQRNHGNTSYSFRKLVQLGLDVILAFSDKPLKLTIKFGMLISALTGILALYTIIQYLRGAITQIGYASQILSIWFLGGIIIFILGVIGLYIGKIFEKVKDRPTYIIQEETTD